MLDHNPYCMRWRNFHDYLPVPIQNNYKQTAKKFSK